MADVIFWQQTGLLPAKQYSCGHCQANVAPNTGYRGIFQSGHVAAQIYICHHCHKPTHFDRMSNQTPSPKRGEIVNDISDQTVTGIFEEAKNCLSANAPTAAVLACRKLLMHIAVSKGAKIGLNFFEYVNYLETNHLLPPDCKDWVDHIRSKGNEANHEIKIFKQADAEEIVDFSTMLLRIVYEFPALSKRKAPLPKP